VSNMNCDVWNANCDVWNINSELCELSNLHFEMFPVLT
jgi:hypothetical protein